MRTQSSNGGKAREGLDAKREVCTELSWVDRVRKRTGYKQAEARHAQHMAELTAEVEAEHPDAASRRAGL